ncbi:MAG: hypothetical protein REI93_04145 [Pedobacter sp.]|nr:hypothetical protein [Pedobacter sp.]
MHTSVLCQQPLNLKAIARYDSLNKAMPAEKLYVHFDKHTYAAPDTIWFKAYLMDGFNHNSTVSGLIYTEMINSSGQIVQTRTLPTTLGLTWGTFEVNEELYPSGTYTFRAYTNWMRNFGERYFFQQELKILSPELLASATTNNKDTQPRTLQQAIFKSTKKDAPDFQFLPESGAWISGAYQKMAFKAVASHGKGIPLTGTIYDSKQVKVCDFKSNDKGMGFFSLTPADGETYTAKINTAFGEFTKSLPKSQATGTAIGVKMQADSVVFTVMSTLPATPLILLGNARGTVIFSAAISPGTSGRIIKIAKSNFPSGVAQVLLMDDRFQVRNERNFFLNFQDALQLELSSPSVQYVKRDRIPLQLMANDSEGNPISGSFSVAITADDQVRKDTLNDAHILSYLLLGAELKGEIEDPGSYFSRKDAQLQNDIDALLLTQGWVGHLQQNMPDLKFKAEKDFAITGKVTNLLNKPVSDAKIILLGKNKSFLMRDTLTNAQGEFIFDQFPLLDSASFVIQALNAKGKKGTLGITVNEFTHPPFYLQKSNLPLNESAEKDSVDHHYISLKAEADRFAINHGITLKEVKITGKRAVPGSKNLNGQGNSSQLLTEKDLLPLAKRTLYEVLQDKIKGFREGPRKKSYVMDFFINSDRAKFIIDGIELDFFYDESISRGNTDYYNFVKSYLTYFNAEDIRGIETMEMGLSFRYKARYGNPLSDELISYIEVTTKTGSGPLLKKSANLYLIRPLNYGNARVFYEPKYNSTNRSSIRPDYRSTIYWNPNVMTDEKGLANFSFFSADRKGTYTIWVEGADMQGKIGIKTMKMEIK